MLEGSTSTQDHDIKKNGEEEEEQEETWGRKEKKNRQAKEQVKYQYISLHLTAPGLMLNFQKWKLIHIIPFLVSDYLSLRNMNKLFCWD